MLQHKQNRGNPRSGKGSFLLARLFIGVAITFLGVEQFLHPELAPGVPLEKLTPLWIPGHALWGYPTGASLWLQDCA